MKRIFLFFLAIFPILIFGQSSMGQLSMPTSDFPFPLAIAPYSYEVTQVDSNLTIVITGSYTTSDNLRDVYSDGNYYVLSGGGGASNWTLTGDELTPSGAYNVGVNSNDSLKVDTIAYLFNEGGNHLGARINNANLNFDIINSPIASNHHYGFGWFNDRASEVTFEIDSDTNAGMVIRGNDYANNHQISILTTNTRSKITSNYLPFDIVSKGNITFNPNFGTSGKWVDVDGGFRADGGFYIFNLTNGDNDFRVDGTSTENLFYINAGDDRIGIGDNAPSYTLDVNGDVYAGTSTIHGSQDTTVTAIVGKIVFQASDSTFYGCRSTVASQKWYPLN